MLRLVLSVALALLVGAGVALAQDAPKKEPPKPKKTAEEIFKEKDKNKDGFLTVDELVGKSKKPEAEQKAKEFIAKKDKNKDGKLSLEEFTAKPEKKEGGKKGKKPAEK
jgi:hypothetical protein